MSREIKLNDGSAALVDEEDYEELSRYRWYRGTGGYAVRSTYYPGTKMARVLSMHRHLMQPPDDMVVDHINRNRLDNRRSNLRICTQAENLRNRSPRGQGGESLQDRRRMDFLLEDKDRARVEWLIENQGCRNRHSMLRTVLCQFARLRGMPEEGDEIPPPPPHPRLARMLEARDAARRLAIDHPKTLLALRCLDLQREVQRAIDGFEATEPQKWDGNPE